MNIETLAKQVSARFDLTPSAAEDATNILISQMEQATGDAIDREHIGADDADFLLESVRRSQDDTIVACDQGLDELRDVSESIKQLQDMESDLTAHRNAIVRHLSKKGVSVITMVQVSGLNRSRLYEILKGRS